MDQHEIRQYEKAGNITAQALEYGKHLIKPGANMLTVCKAVEAKIMQLGGVPAFPVQIAVNHVAAHLCPDPDEEILFKEGDICKLDVGVHVDGYIADTAVTVDLGDHDNLVKASKEACEAALKLVAPGTQLRELGNAIQEVITSYEYAPIKNLGGHGLKRFELHASPSVPNYDNHDKTVLEEGMIIAIEPFATTGAGMVQEMNKGNIYSHVAKKPVRNPYARKVQDELARFGGMPFTTHWLATPQKPAEMGLRELLSVGAVECHAPLTEVRKGLVSQHEHSVIVGKKPIVYTKL
jgi:methionyl aminopeptidase